jgi:prepilin signal peptidase PulO-like enzyme (type II secretory pathway)
MKLKALDYTLIVSLVLSIAIYFTDLDQNLFWTGFVWSITFGLAAGSYATSFVARIPKAIPSLGARHPYCHNCDKDLAAIDLFPVISYLLTSGKCRYCKTLIPPSLLWTELLVLISFIVCYLYFGYTEEYILLSSLLTTHIILIMLIIYSKVFAINVVLLAFILSLMHNMLLNNSIYNIALPCFTGLIATSFIKCLVANNQNNVSFKNVTDLWLLLYSSSLIMLYTS